METRLRSWEELSVLEQYACIYSDIFKDAYGFRPRGEYPKTVEEYDLELGRLQLAINATMAEERAFEKASIELHEESIAKVMASGGVDRDTAIRWMAEAEGFYGRFDVEGYVYGLGFGGTDYGDALVEKIDSLVEYMVYRPAEAVNEMDDYFG